MLTNADTPADAAYALAGVYVNPGAPRASGPTAPSSVKPSTGKGKETGDSRRLEPGTASRGGTDRPGCRRTMIAPP